MRAKKYRFDPPSPQSEDPDRALWAPLERFARVARADPYSPVVPPCEFMRMGTATHRSGHRIILYKHSWTRCYLNLDEAGHAFRCCGEADPDDLVFWYKPQPTPLAAIACLDLWMMDQLEDRDRYWCEACRALLAAAPARPTVYRLSDPTETIAP